MTTPAGPELSVLLVTDTFETIRKILHYFRAQERSEVLEVVVVAPREAALTKDTPDLQGFTHAQIVEVDDISVPPPVRAKAVRAARAPLILLAETHAYPRPGYVEALIRAHRTGPWAVIGPSMGNANPGSLVSWVSLFLDYGPWVESDRRGVADDVPGHNAAYKRAALLELGDELELHLRADSLMHAELRERGHELYLEPDAVCDHLNVSSLYWALVEHFHSGRKFAGQRARTWSWRLRLLFAGGAPLIPAVRAYRIVRDIRRSGRTDLLPRVLPVLLLVLGVSAAGELVGYVAGPGRSPLLYQIEIFKSRYTRPSDQAADADERAWPD
jgi:hypothetical protein